LTGWAWFAQDAIVRFVIADDHALYRAGLRLALQLQLESTVVFEASDGHEAVALAERERPDVAILDLAMSRLNGAEAAERILAALPTCKVVILSSYGDEQGVLEAFRRGASAYVLKSAPVVELMQALDAVASGHKFVSAEISSTIAARVHEGQALGPSPLDGLTARQREILQLIAEGQSTKEIAYRLGLSGKTVETHRRQVMERLRIFDVANLVRFALRAGLVRSE
jgi:DNA-binding NarL/FixJ family response regulator